MTSSIQSETSWNFLFYCFPENLDNLYQGTQIFHPPSTGVGKKFKNLFIHKRDLPSLLAYCRDKRVPPSTGVEFKFIPQNFSVLVPAQYWGGKVSSKLDPQNRKVWSPSSTGMGKFSSFLLTSSKLPHAGATPNSVLFKAVNLLCLEQV